MNFTVDIIASRILASFSRLRRSASRETATRLYEYGVVQDQCVPPDSVFLVAQVIYIFASALLRKDISRNAFLQVSVMPH